MFAWAADEELIPIGNYQALATVAGLRKGRTEAREKPPVRPVPDEQVERVLPHLSPTVATIERDLKSPTVDTLSRICDALGESAADIVRRADAARKRILRP
jgi:transcriptional regulator with XRE-family HTH domain